MKYSDLLLENKAQYTQMMQPLIDNDIISLAIRLDGNVQQVITSARQVLKRNDRITWYLKWYRLLAFQEAVQGVDPRFEDGIKIQKLYDKSKKALQLSDADAEDSADTFYSLFGNFDRVHTKHILSMMEKIPALEAHVWSGNPRELWDNLRDIETEWKEQRHQEIQVDDYETDAWEVLIDYNGKQGWVLLDMEYCSLEGNAMGHCGNRQGRDGLGDRILSFRTITSDSHKPHLTFILNADGKLGEMKGRSNEKPAEKYHAAIIALLKHDIVKGFGPGGHEPENNFSMEDLSSDVMDELLKEKPALMSIYVKIRGEMDLDESDRGEVIALLTDIQDEVGKHGYNPPEYMDNGAVLFDVVQRNEVSRWASDYHQEHIEWMADIIDEGHFDIGYSNFLEDSYNMEEMDEVLTEYVLEAIHAYLEKHLYADVTAEHTLDTLSDIWAIAAEHDLDDLTDAIQRGYEQGESSGTFDNIDNALERALASNGLVYDTEGDGYDWIMDASAVRDLLLDTENSDNDIHDAIGHALRDANSDDYAGFNKDVAIEYMLDELPTEISNTIKSLTDAASPKNESINRLKQLAGIV
jgi:hypothetical protein